MGESSNNVMVRVASPTDLATLAPALAELPLLKRYGRDATQLAASWQAALGRGECLFVACDASGPCGLAWFLLGGTFGVGGYLRLIAVTTHTQARGVGAALLDCFERETFHVSRHAFLLVSDFNADAQRFYERHGYSRVGVVPGLVLSDVGEVIYWKKRPEA